MYLLSKNRKLYDRLIYKYRRILTNKFSRRIFNLTTKTPLISFSFDDAPQSAIINGGNILENYGVKGTFYMSLGLLGSHSPSGKIADLSDLYRVVGGGHELGCHTFDHKNSWETMPENFVKSILKNRTALSRILPKTSFKSFAYPICGPRPSTKKHVGKLFQCCRGGGQTYNIGKIDLNYLKSFFLDERNGHKIDTIKNLINKNIAAGGWLIFSTHDIQTNPSRYGCSIKTFDKVVEYSVKSGATLVPVGLTYEYILKKNRK